VVIPLGEKNIVRCAIPALAIHIHVYNSAVFIFLTKVKYIQYFMKLLGWQRDGVVVDVKQDAQTNKGRAWRYQMTWSHTWTDTEFIEKGEELLPEITPEAFRTNANEVVNID
jgi:hypothetical protein